MKILLVEDKVELACLLADNFKDHGHHCHNKTSALGALELLEKETFDVIICDLHLPHINGETFSVKVKSLYKTPVILMSGDYKILDSKNFDAFILKPFNFDELLDLVELVTQAQIKLGPQKDLFL
jgi:two-component system, OmpR family, alkaline phosphatase synthesis response regulator PhoP